MNLKKIAKNKGFTLIEILVVIGIIAILAAVVLVAINPARQFAQARNSQRQSNVNSILNAIGQQMVDHRGVFDCASGALPSTVTAGAPVTEIMSGLADVPGGQEYYDIRPCLVPIYMSELPFDPSATGAGNTCVDTAGTADCATGEYNTGYNIWQDATSRRITVCAPEAVNETAIQPTPVEICVTR